MKSRVLIWTVTCGFFLSCSNTNAATYIVKSDGSGDYPTIQAAISAAVGGDIIRVEDGTYTGTGNRDIDFLGKAVTVRGNVTDPNLVVIDCQGTETQPHRGFKFVNGEGNNSILESLTITHGYGPDELLPDPSSYRSAGGGIYCNNSSPTISHVAIVNNTAERGGGICSYNYSHPIITNCIINYNSSGLGGGVCNYRYCDPVITGCEIKYNSADSDGAGLYNHYRSDPEIAYCDISYNSANQATAIMNHYYSSSVLTNCIISHNTADFGHVGILNDYSSATVKNCTIVDNSAPYGPGCVLSFTSTSSAVIENTIMWNNTQSEVTGYNLTVRYCNIRGGYEGPGNIDADPLFLDDSYHLGYASPCIDAGDPLYDGVGETDMDGDMRVFQTIDIGVDEVYCDTSSLIVTSSENLVFQFEGISSDLQSQQLLIKNYGAAALDWQIHQPAVDWIELSSVTGQLETGESVPVTITVDPNRLGYGEHLYDLQITADGAANSPQIVRINLEVLQPEIGTSAASFSFACDVDEPNVLAEVLHIYNAGYDTLAWQISESCDWLTVLPDSGQCTSETDEVTVTVNTEGLERGLYSCNLQITGSYASSSPLIIPVSLKIYRAGERHVPDEYPVIQAAINAAADGDHVIVHPGRYTSNYIRYGGKAITVRSIDPTDPAIVASTILSVCQISFGMNEGPGSILEGLTFQDCGSESIICMNSSPIVKNCIFENNILTYKSSVISLFGSSAQIRNCIIRNTILPSMSRVSAIGIDNGRPGGHPRIENCIISSVYNDADSVQGPAVLAGISVIGGALDVVNCTIAYNHSCREVSGYHATSPGVFIQQSDVFLRNLIIRENYADDAAEIIIVNDLLNSHVEVCCSNVDGGQENILIFPNPTGFNNYLLNGILPDPGAVDPNTLIWGTGNMDADPLFARQPDDGGDGWLDDAQTTDRNESVNNDCGDLHLKSQEGRFVWDGFARADFNMDKHVDLKDFSTIAESWGLSTANVPYGFPWNKCDLDRNLEIGLGDLEVFCADYLQPRVFGAWVTDEVTSPCIDAGDPNDAGWQKELWPHGKRINMGAYGGTPQASMSPNPAGNIIDLNHDGKVDLADWSQWADDWILEKVLMDADVDRDNDTDMDDLVILADQWLWTEL